MTTNELNKAIEAIAALSNINEYPDMKDLLKHLGVEPSDYKDIAEYLICTAKFENNHISEDNKLKLLNMIIIANDHTDLREVQRIDVYTDSESTMIMCYTGVTEPQIIDLEAFLNLFPSSNMD